MNFIAKIYRTLYKKLKQGDVPPFVKSILLKMKDNDAYPNLEDIIAQLEAALEIYEAALAASKSGDKQKIADKDIAKATLLSLLDELSDGVEFFGKKEMTYFLGTGLPLQTKPTSHAGVTMKVPLDFVVKSNGQPGGVQVTYRIDKSQKNLCKMVGYEWSLDLENWHNGDYGTKLKFDVVNMPSNQKIYVKIRAIGTDGRTSPWTEPGSTSVL